MITFLIHMQFCRKNYPAVFAKGHRTTPAVKRNRRSILTYWFKENAVH